MIKELNVANAGQAIDTQWSRLTLTYSENPIVASCHLCNIHTALQVKACIGQRCFPELTSRYDLSIATQATLFRALVHIDLNRHDRAKTIGAFFSNPQLRPKVIALQVSSDRVSDGHAIVDNNWIWLSMGTSRHAYLEDGWLEQFMGLDWESASRIAKAPLDQRGGLYDLEEQFGKLLDITHPGKPENQLAYCLLRAAQAACEGKEQVENFHNTGITIHSPNSLEDWWKPFDSEEDKAIRNLARCIVEESDADGDSIWNEVKTHVTSGDDKALKSAVATFLKVPDTKTTLR